MIPKTPPSMDEAERPQREDPSFSEAGYHAARQAALLCGALHYKSSFPERRQTEVTQRLARQKELDRQQKDQEALKLWRTLRGQARARNPFGPFLNLVKHDPVHQVQHLSVMVVTHGVLARDDAMPQAEARAQEPGGASSSSSATHMHQRISADFGTGDQAVPEVLYREYHSEEHVVEISTSSRAKPWEPGAKERVKVHRQQNWVHAKAELVYEHKGIYFWRWPMALQCKEESQIIEYALADPDGYSDPARFHFWLPPAKDPWHIGFFSGNDTHASPENAKAPLSIQPLWRDVLAQHNKRPFHLLISGGDVVCNDEVWKCPSLQAWLNLPSKKERIAHPFTEQMLVEVEDCYLRRYLEHWTEDEWSGALSVIPHAMIWNDKEIFDGYGCFGPELQSCPVFQGIFAAARKFFALFAYHAKASALQDERPIFGGLHSLTCLGPSQALLLIDTRSERSKECILSAESTSLIKEHLMSLPASIQHILIVSTVPLIFPVVPAAAAAKCCSFIGQGRRVGSMVRESNDVPYYEKFGGVNVIHDAIGHWSADLHSQEKRGLVRMLQEVAASKSTRVSLLCGEVHLACAGHFSSSESLPIQQDHRYMKQIVSSAIGDAPPPARLVGMLQSVTLAGYRKTSVETLEQLDSAFGLRAQRNWCDITSSKCNMLSFTVRFEREYQPHTVQVPPLQPPKTQQAT